MKKHLLVVGLAAATAFGSVSAQTAQASLSISTDNTQWITPGSPITLTTSGGSGSGAVSWKVATGSDCWLIWSSNGMLLDGSVGTVCSLTAKKVASSGYLEAMSGSKTFSFSKVQDVLTVSNTTTTGIAGTAIALTTSGGSGTGAVTLAVTGTDCKLIGSNLGGPAGGSCSVTATKAATAEWAATTSVAKTFNFLRTQDALSVGSTTATVSAGVPIALTMSGGSGVGAVTLAVTGEGCLLNGNMLTGKFTPNPTQTSSPSTWLTCNVTVTKAATPLYAEATSPPTAFQFNCPALADSWTISASKTGLRGVSLSYTAPPVYSGWIGFKAVGTGGTSSTSTSSPGTLTISTTPLGTMSYQVYGSTNGGCTYASQTSNSVQITGN